LKIAEIQIKESKQIWLPQIRERSPKMDKRRCLRDQEVISYKMFTFYLFIRV